MGIGLIGHGFFLAVTAVSAARSEFTGALLFHRRSSLLARGRLVPQPLPIVDNGLGSGSAPLSIGHKPLLRELLGAVHLLLSVASGKHAGRAFALCRIDGSLSTYRHF